MADDKEQNQKTSEQPGQTASAREQLCARLLKEPDGDLLWEVMTRFAGESFLTSKGLDFFYLVKLGKHGQPVGELVISRKEKTITKATVDIAFQKVLELGEGKLPAVVTGPKKLGCFGASYLYPVFLRLGIIVTGREGQQTLDLGE